MTKSRRTTFDNGKKEREERRMNRMKRRKIRKIKKGVREE